MDRFYSRYEHRLNCWGFDLRVLDFKDSLTPKAIENDVNLDIFFARDLKPEPKTILDIGANTGIVAMTLAKRYPQSRILAVECAPYNVDALRKNLLLNDIVNVTVMPVAVWSEADKEIELFQTPWGSGELSQFNSPGYPSIKVLTVSLNQLLLSNPWDFVKIDIEGAEYEAFKTVSLDAYRNLKRLQIEIHDRPGMDPFEDAKEQKTLHDTIAAYIGVANITAGMLKSIWHQGVLAPPEKQPHKAEIIDGVLHISEKEA